MPRACNSGCICSAVIRTCIGEGGCIFSHQSMHSGCVNVWGEEERRPWPAAEDAVGCSYQGMHRRRRSDAQVPWQRMHSQSSW